VPSGEQDERLGEQVLEHVAEIAAGRCSITDATIAAEPDASSQEILAGLLMLHEDLEYGRLRQVTLLQELRDAVRARDEFLSVASHELRTPLTTLGLQVDGLPRALQQQMGSLPENVSRRLGLIGRQVERLSALVTSLVDVSRISSGKLQLSKERADLVEIVRAVAERFGDDARRSGSALVFEGQGPKAVFCKAGDVYFTNHQAWHRGAPNTSDRIRYVMQLQYAARWADARFKGLA